MKIKNLFSKMNLQLFAEGAATGEGGTSSEGNTGVNATDAVSQKGVKNNPLANVVYGKQIETDSEVHDADVQIKAKEEKPSNRDAEFEKLIKGEYKDLYDARVQETVQKRLKNTKETVEKYESLSPVLEMLGQKYGVDASDINALKKAIEDDDVFYEEEAFENGLSVEQLKATKKLERENSDLKRQLEKQKADDAAKKIYSEWLEQSEKAKSKYPSLNLNEEIKNPQFANLLRSGIDVESAYTVIHKDEIIPAAMQYTAKTVEQKMADKIISNGARPTENGIQSQSAALTKSDVSQLTKADRAEIARRVARGEKIRF